MFPRVVFSFGELATSDDPSCHQFQCGDGLPGLLASSTMPEDLDGRQVGPLLLGSLDYVWSRIRDRLSG